MEMLQLSSGYGSIDVPLSFSRTHCHVFLFQVVRLFLFGALDEDIKTAKMRPRHGRRRRPAEVVETIVSLLTLLDGGIEGETRYWREGGEGGREGDRRREGGREERSRESGRERGKEGRRER